MQNLVGTHRCPTFVHAKHLLPLPLATFVSATCLPSTSSTCVRTCCKTSLLPTAVQHSYVLLICHLHRRPAIISVAEARWYVRLSYIRMGFLSAVYIIDLHSYMLQKLIGTQSSPKFLRAAGMQSTPLTCVCTCCRTSLLQTTVLHSYMLRICCHCRWLHSYMRLVCRQHHRPTFVRVAEPRWYTPLFYIRTCCTFAAINAGYIRMCYSSAVNIFDLRSYVLQNLVAIHSSPTSVGAARLPSMSSTCIRKHCRSSLVCTALLHS